MIGSLTETSWRTGHGFGCVCVRERKRERLTEREMCLREISVYRDVRSVA